MADELARELGVDPSKLRNTITEGHLLEIKWSIAWKVVGPHLQHINQRDIVNIDENNFGGEAKKRALVDLWKRRNRGNATYYNMITAMLDSGREDQAVDACILLKEGYDVLGEAPTMRSLQSLDVLERIGYYDLFGVKLLNDPDGKVVAEIFRVHQTPRRTKKEIARQWLRGGGREPVTWRTLIEVLKMMFDERGDKKLRHLIRDIRQALARSLPSTPEPEEPTALMTDEKAQEIIDKAMESGSLEQRDVVGVITGLMGSGKTTLLHHLFGMAPPDHYTSTGITGQSFRGFLHHVIRLSAGAWHRLSYNDIREFLAPLIRAGMKEADVHSLSSRLMEDLSTRSIVNAGSIEESVVATSSDEATVTPLEVAHPLEKESPACKKIAALVKKVPTAADPQQDLVLELVHMIDTGGQPELMEVMPSLIHNANLALVLVDLRYTLDEYPPVTFHEKGVAHKPHECKSHSRYNGKDIIMKLVSTLHAKKSVNEAFRLLIVATHRDCVTDDLDARVKSLNSKLYSLLLPDFKDELILFESPSKIAFVLNLKNPDDKDKQALDLIRTQARQSGLGKNFKTPTSFFVFEQDLIHFSESEERGILSLKECREVGKRLKMSDEMVEAALILFHRQNTFLYFRDVLPNHVFVKPQVPLDIVRGIVSLSYKKLQAVPANVAMLIKDAIITEEILGYDGVSPHFIEGFYEIKDAIKLLCHTFTLAPLEPPDTAKKEAAPVDDKKKQYLMMCMKPVIPDQDLLCYLPKPSDTVVPLVLKFSSGCVPLGCFGSTISCLLSKYGWQVCRKEDNTPTCLAHNIASLYDPDHLLDVVLVDQTQHIEIHTDTDLSILPPNTCSELCTTIFGAIEKVLNIMHLADHVKISPAVVCPCRKIREKHHAAFEKCLLRCRNYTSKPDEKHLIWMGSDTPDSRPTLPQMMRLNIPEKIGVNYEKFGILLLNDKDGYKVENLVFPNNQPEHIVTSILRKWVQEEPTPVTWENLIEKLREAKLVALAANVEKAHRDT